MAEVYLLPSRHTLQGRNLSPTIYRFRLVPVAPLGRSSCNGSYLLVVLLLVVLLSSTYYHCLTLDVRVVLILCHGSTTSNSEGGIQQ